MRFLHQIGLVLALHSVCAGALEWKHQVVEIEAGLLDRTATATFAFKNAGRTPVTILEIQPNCSCTTAETLQWSYQPSEVGEIKAVFDFGDRTGLQEKTIKVTTDDPETPATTLRLRVDIPVLLSFSPHHLEWTKENRTAEQAILVTVADPMRTAAIEILSPPPAGFAVRIATVESGRQFKVIVRPMMPSDESPSLTPIPCVARLDDGTLYPFRVRAMMR